MDKLIAAEKRLIEAEAFLRSHVVKTAAVDGAHWCSDCRAYCAAIHNADLDLDRARQELVAKRVAELG